MNQNDLRKAFGAYDNYDSESFADDWNEAFKVAINNITAVVGDNEVSTEPFEPKDIMWFIGTIEGENDEENWEAAFILKDGRFVYMEAGCDYTGWG